MQVLVSATAQGAEPIRSKSYLAIRGTDGDPWLSVPRCGGQVTGGPPASASAFFIEKVDGSAGDVVRSNDYVKIRGTDGDPWLHVPDGPDSGPVTGGHPSQASVFVLVKEANGSSPGLELRLGDYVHIRGTAVDPWLSIPKGGGLLKGGGPGGKSLFVIADAGLPQALAGGGSIVRNTSCEAPATPDKSRRIELGWGNAWPCSKVENVRNDLGFESPAFKVSKEQRIYAYAEVDSPLSADAVGNTIRGCALKAVGACGLTSLISSPAACLPAFKTAFATCITAELPKLAVPSVKLSVESQCIW
jgi:hypothetical protein